MMFKLAFDNRESVMNSKPHQYGPRENESREAIKSTRNIHRPNSVDTPFNEWRDNLQQSIKEETDRDFQLEPSQSKRHGDANRRADYNPFLESGTSKQPSHLKSTSSRSLFHSFQEGLVLESLTEKNEGFPFGKPKMIRDSDSCFILKLDMDQQTFRGNNHTSFNQSEVSRVFLQGFASSREIKFVDKINEDNTNSQNFHTFQKSQQTFQTPNFEQSENNTILPTGELTMKSTSFSYKMNQNVPSPSFTKPNNGLTCSERFSHPSNSKSHNIVTDLNNSKDSDRLARECNLQMNSRHRQSEEDTRSKEDSKLADAEVRITQAPKSEFFNRRTTLESSKSKKEALNNFFTKIEGIQEKILNLEQKFDRYGDLYKSAVENRERTPSTTPHHFRATSQTYTEDPTEVIDHHYIDIKRRALNSSRHFPSKTLSKQGSKDLENSTRNSQKMNLEKASESSIHKNRYNISDRKFPKIGDNGDFNSQRNLDAFAKARKLRSELWVRKSFSIDKMVDDNNSSGETGYPMFRTFINEDACKGKLFLRNEKPRMFTEGQDNNDLIMAEPIHRSQICVANFQSEDPKYQFDEANEKLVQQGLSKKQKKSTLSNKPMPSRDIESVLNPLVVHLNDSTCKVDTQKPNKGLSLVPLILDPAMLSSIETKNQNLELDGTKGTTELIQCELLDSLNSKKEKAMNDVLQANNDRDVKLAVLITNFSEAKQSLGGNMLQSSSNNLSQNILVSMLARYEKEKIRLENFQGFLDQIRNVYRQKLEKATNFKNNVLRPYQRSQPEQKRLYQNLENTYQDFKKEVHEQNRLLDSNLRIFSQQLAICVNIKALFDVIEVNANACDISKNLATIGELFNELDQLHPVHHFQGELESEVKFSCVTNLAESVVERNSIIKPKSSAFKSSRVIEFPEFENANNQEVAQLSQPVPTPRETVTQMISHIQEKYNLKGQVPFKLLNNQKPNQLWNKLEPKIIRNECRRQRSCRMKNKSSIVECEKPNTETHFFRALRQQIDSLSQSFKKVKPTRAK